MERKPVRITHLRDKKQRGEKIAMLTQQQRAQATFANLNAMI